MPRMKWWGRPWICLAVFALHCSRNSLDSSDLDQLALALEGPRPTRARLTIKLPYRAPDEAGPGPNIGALMQLSTAVDGLLRRGADADARRYKAFLRLGEPGGIHAAAAELEIALAQWPDQANVLSDLAALHFEMAQHHGRPEMLPEAYDAATQALRLEPGLEEAHFNLALILEKLGLWEDARGAWDRYLELDSQSPYAAEARTYRAGLPVGNGMEQWRQTQQRIHQAVAAGRDIDALVVPIQAAPQTATPQTAAPQTAAPQTAAPFLSAAYRYVTDELLPAWGRGERDLKVARALAAAIEKANGDAFLLDILSAIDAEPGQAPQFRHCFRAYGAFLQDNDWTRLEPFRQKAPGPFRYQIEIETAGYFQNQHEQAVRIAEAMLARLSPAPWTYLKSQVWWNLALSADSLGQMGKTRRAYARVLDLNRASGYHDLFYGVMSLYAGLLARLGEEADAWHYLIAVGARLDRFIKPRRLNHFFANAALTAERFKHYELALRYGRQMEKLTLSPWNRTGYLLHHARHLHLAGHEAEAWETLEQARQALALVTSDETRGLLSADLTLAAATLTKTRGEAIRLLEKGLAKSDEMGHLVFETIYLTELAHNYRRIGDLKKARSRLAQAFDLYENHRSDLAASSRIHLYDTLTDLFDLSIEMALEDGDAAAAFYRFEQGRSRVLAERMARDGRAVPPLEISQIQAALTPGQTLLAFAQSGDRWVVWPVGRQGFEAVGLQAEAQVVERMVGRLLGQIKSGAVLEDTAWERDILYRGLLEPVESYFKRGELVLVTTGILNRLPFGVLARSGEQALGLRMPLVYAPSAQVFVLCRNKARTLPGEGRALVVGAERFDRMGNPRLGDLPAVGDETHAIADLYQVRAMQGEDATVEAFLERAPGARLIHFAGHAVVHPFHPERTRLLMQPTPAHPGGALELGMLEQSLALKGTALVVLSACSTAAGPVLGSEGLASLVRGFIAAGAPTVVATLWQVNDRAAAAFSTAFHQHLSRGASPARALQMTQNDLADYPLRDWAAFLCLGYGGEGEK